MKAAAAHIREFAGLLQKAGPYLLIEILLPGGTLVALLLFLYRRGTLDPARIRAVVERTLASIGSPLVVVIDRAVAVVAFVPRRAADADDGLAALAMAPAI